MPSAMNKADIATGRRFGGNCALYGLFGHPVGHSLSPAMQNAAFAACGLEAVYLPFAVAPAELAAAVAAIRALGIRGVNVTIPHKRAVVEYLDKTDGEAALSGSVNTIVWRDDALVGYSTDGEGFIRSLREETGFEPAGRKVCLLGTGGAALALAVRLGREGVGGLTVVTRQQSKETLGWPLEACPDKVLTYERVRAEPGALAACDLIVNTTPLGMSPHEDAMPALPATVFHPGMILYDLIYRPAVTKLMRVAKEAGAKVSGGLGMLVHQGAISFELWTGKPAPVAEMRAAAINALSQ
ncbi:MAG: shikimate dehydrogenase [Bacteroidota bacterium]